MTGCGCRTLISGFAGRLHSGLITPLIRHIAGNRCGKDGIMVRFTCVHPQKDLHYGRATVFALAAILTLAGLCFPVSADTADNSTTSVTTAVPAGTTVAPATTVATTTQTTTTAIPTMEVTTVVTTATPTATQTTAETTATTVVTTTAVALPAAGFTADSTSGPTPLLVQFTDESTNSPTAWSWDFGDGGTSTDQNPAYTYASPGDYTVSLTATNDAGSNTDTEDDFISVGNATPVAGFTTNVTSGTAPLSVQFNDTSSNAPTAWYWNFGDGYTSDIQDPVHLYTVSGTFSVVLTVTNDAGSNVTTANDCITVSGPATVTDETTVTNEATTALPTYDLSATKNSSSSVDEWLEKENAKIDNVATTSQSPGFDFLISLAGLGAFAGIAGRRRR